MFTRNSRLRSRPNVLVVKSTDRLKLSPWTFIDSVEPATLYWVDRYNNQRLLESIGDIPLEEFEQAYHGQREKSAMAA